MNLQNKCLVCTCINIIQGEDMRSLLIRKGEREILLEFPNSDDMNTVIQILDRTRIPLSFQDLIANFPLQKKQEVEKIVSRFVELKILIDDVTSEFSNFVMDRDFEQALDNYFWEKEISWPEFLRHQETLSVRIVGFNNMGTLVFDLLKKMGVHDVRLIDYPYLKNKKSEQQLIGNEVMSFDQFISSKDKNRSIVIVADEFGNIPSLLHLNQIFFNERIPYLPLFILLQVGYIGPFVVPGKTSCFECFLSRIEGTGGKINLLNASEIECFEWQEQSSTHPSVMATVSHFFSFHFTSNMRYTIKPLSTETSDTNLQQKVIDLLQNYCNKIVEIDLTTPQIFKRHILRKPNCSCCRRLMVRQKVVFDFVKENIS